MHEWALAEAVLETVRQNTGEQDLKNVKVVNVLFGELQDVDPEIFESGLAQLLEDYPFDIDVFHMHIEEASFLCNRCGSSFTLKAFPNLGEDERESIHFLPEAAHVYLQCPDCGSADFKVVKGRGVTIQSIEIEKAEA